jgi:hypothetical protein
LGLFIDIQGAFDNVASAIKALKKKGPLWFVTWYGTYLKYIVIFATFGDTTIIFIICDGTPGREVSYLL